MREVRPGVGRGKFLAMLRTGARFFDQDLVLGRLRAQEFVDPIVAGKVGRLAPPVILR